MQTLFKLSSYRLMWVAGSVLILSSVASIAVVLAWSPIPISSHSVTPSSSAAPTPTVITKAYTTLAPPISNPLEENLEMTALLDLHRYARSRILPQDNKIAVRFEDTSSCVFQKAVWNLAD